jgi:hypothetical protein
MPTKYMLIDKKTKEILNIPGVTTTWNRTPSNRAQIFPILNAICPNKYVILEEILTGREAVNAYLNSSKVSSKSPLFFKNRGTNVSSDYTPEYLLTPVLVDISEEFSEQKSLDNKILFLLRYSRSCGSYERNSNYYETSSGRRRSSLDLWRHLITYYPKYTIFDVMHSLYRLAVKNIVTYNYCSVVKRLVFLGGNNYGYHNYHDEYGMHLNDWKDI